MQTFTQSLRSYRETARANFRIIILKDPLRNPDISCVLAVLTLVGGAIYEVHLLYKVFWQHHEAVAAFFLPLIVGATLLAMATVGYMVVRVNCKRESEKGLRGGDV